MIRDDLIRDEGWRSHVYKDTLGFDTVGFGFLVDERRGGGMPKEVGEFWLDLLINANHNELCRDYPWYVDSPEPVRRAIQNLRYQLGRSGLAGFRKMIEALAYGNYQVAAHEAMDSRWAKQTPARARRITALIRKGDYAHV